MRGGKRGLARVVAHQEGLGYNESLVAVRVSIRAMIAWMASGRPLHIRGLGTFTPMMRDAQERTSPSDPVKQVPERATLLFRPSPRLRAALYRKLKGLPKRRRAP
jgi:nucleoid DNA-binding protein